TELCAGVAEGLGLPAPEPTVPMADVEPSPALSQVGQSWPTDGRLIGIVTGPDGDLDGVRAVREAVLGADTGAYIETPVRVPEATKVREAPESFSDHFSQPRRFWLSMSAVEREHIIAAYTFELGKCYEQAIKERGLQVLANIDTE
ncbi:catalase-related domain-containing protein, partial [Streptomyces sp. NRRL S-146]|uniref:catalase-related domain-containing protein n=1 Tax=Streptomyces sp. NRRL S-146 TaxID=1463884 RepID=UPI000562FF5D